MTEKVQAAEAAVQKRALRCRLVVAVLLLLRVVRQGAREPIRDERASERPPFASYHSR